jgi:superfamily II DNA or RNA helicase
MIDNKEDLNIIRITRNNLGILRRKGKLTAQNTGIYNPNFKRFTVVMCQQSSECGVDYDILVSLLQKSIRRGDWNRTAYAVVQIVNIGGVMISNLINRLLIIGSEDIGAASLISNIAFNIYIKLKFFRRYYKDECNEVKHNKEYSVNVKNAMLLEIRLDEAYDPNIRKYLMIWAKLLCDSKKSRMVDILANLPPSYTIDNKIVISLDNFLYGLQVKDIITTSKMLIQVFKDNYTDNFDNIKGKRLEIFKYFKCMLNYSNDAIIRKEILALINIFSNKKNILPILHVLCLVVYGYNEIGRLDRQLIYNWEQIRYSKLDIPSYVIDMHTKSGKKYLDKSHINFWLNGSKLNNWYPIGEEKKYLHDIINYHTKPEDIKVHKLRPCQEQAVVNIISELKHNSHAKMIAPCGFGKTLVMIVTIQYAIRVLNIKIIIIVSPKLQISTQTYSVHRKFLLLDNQNKYTEVGVVASKFETNLTKCDKCTYTILKNNAEIIDYLNDDNIQIKYIYTTYKSIKKLINITGITNVLTIYDEAHHLNHIVPFGKHLYVTATDCKRLQCVTQTYGYTIRAAIRERYLVDYEFNIKYLNDNSPDEQCEYIYELLRSNKVKKIIFFSRTNAISHDLYDYFERQYGKEIKSMYIDGTMKNKNDIFDEYENYKDKVVIFNCKMYSEGIDVRSCDCVCFNYPLKSFVSIIQGFCRCLRVDPDNKNKKATMVMLGIYDDESKIDNTIKKFSCEDPDVYDKLRIL